MMPPRPCKLPDDCEQAIAASTIAQEARRVAVASNEAALEAIEKASSAKTGEILLSRKLESIDERTQQIDARTQKTDRRTRWQLWLQWAVPILLTAWGLWQNWKQNSQDDRIAKAVEQSLETKISVRIASHEKTTEEVALKGGTIGGQVVADRVQELLKQQPIQSLQVLAPRTKQR